MGERDKWKEMEQGGKLGKMNTTMEQGKKHVKKIEMDATWEGEGKMGGKNPILNLKMTNRTQFL